jgi:hypothetical protein
MAIAENISAASIFLNRPMYCPNPIGLCCAKQRLVLKLNKPGQRLSAGCALRPTDFEPIKDD